MSARCEFRVGGPGGKEVIKGRLHPNAIGWLLAGERDARRGAEVPFREVRIFVFSVG
jgi:hypothetical protein